ncbi:hypothetical protein WJX84_001126 [Apatococcus fuscideae]|uniref:Uncharacterized protein n=1 Tax=Apatococcus fuscideae TaxID=2026836 RepID=A0AAW1T153_9CHLO
MDLGAAVVREVAKLSMVGKASARYAEDCHAIALRLPDRPLELYLDPAVVRRNDTSAKSVNEWTGEKILQDGDIAGHHQACGHAAPGQLRHTNRLGGRLQPGWWPLEQLESLPHLSPQDLNGRRAPKSQTAGRTTSKLLERPQSVSWRRLLNDEPYTEESWSSRARPPRSVTCLFDCPTRLPLPKATNSLFFIDLYAATLPTVVFCCEASPGSRLQRCLLSRASTVALRLRRVVRRSPGEDSLDCQTK